MLRNFLLVVATVLASTSFDAQSAQARRFSLNNPYSSFNISGINYGSMKWEQDHGSRRSVFQGSRRALLRRR